MSVGDITTFDVEQQSGQSISNVGGDQMNYYRDSGGAGRVGKILGVVGLCMSVVGVALLVLVVVAAVHNVVHDLHAAGVKPLVVHDVPAVWPGAVGLLVGGFVVSVLRGLRWGDDDVQHRPVCRDSRNRERSA